MERVILIEVPPGILGGKLNFNTSGLEYAKILLLREEDLKGLKNLYER